MDVEARGARAGERAVRALRPDLPEQPGENGPVDGVVAGGLAVDPSPALLAHELGELPAHIGPFAHAHERDEVVVTPRAHPAPRMVLTLLVVLVPERQQREKIRLRAREAPVRFVGGARGGVRALAGILHRKRRRDREHLAQASFFGGSEDHATQARIDRQAGEAAPQVREPIALVERAQLAQRVLPVGDHPPGRWIQERELAHVAESQGLHAQDHARKVAAEDLGGRVGLAAVEVLFLVESQARARPEPAASARALAGRRLRDALDGKPLDARPRAVAAQPGQPRIDHESDARHGERGLSDVGGQHDAPLRRRLEDALLLGCRQPRVQRQHLQAVVVAPAQDAGGGADLPLAAQEDENVAGPLADRLVHGTEDRLQHRRLGLVELAAIRGAVAHLDRVHAPLDLQDRRSAEVAAEALRVDGRGADDDLQLRPSGREALQVAQQEVDVEAALVRLVDDDGVVLGQRPVALRLGQQDAVGHDLDVGVRAGAVGETHLEADGIAEGGLQLIGEASGDRAGGDPARLREADPSSRAASCLQADLRKLGGLAGTGLAAHDDHWMPGQGAHDHVALADDGQLGGVGDRDIGGSGHRGRMLGATARDG